MLSPLNTQVLIRPEVEEKAQSSLLIVESREPQNATAFAEVLACGPEVSQVTCGQRVLCNADAIMEVNGDFVVPEDQIFAVVE